MSYSAEGVFFILGCLLGALSVSLVVWLLPKSYPTLQDCAKQHNVYACEYVAVPKKEGS